MAEMEGCLPVRSRRQRAIGACAERGRGLRAEADRGIGRSLFKDILRVSRPSMHDRRRSQSNWNNPSLVTFIFLVNDQSEIFLIRYSNGHPRGNCLVIT